MNPIEERIHDDDVRFDRLVDGELTDAQRRELLSRLDDEPGGWRQCALAFLEAQALGEDLGAIARDAASASDRPQSSTTGSFWTRGHGGTLVAMAASFLVALTAVLAWQQIRHGPVPAAPGSAQLADNLPGGADPSFDSAAPGPTAPAPAADPRMLARQANPDDVPAAADQSPQPAEEPFGGAWQLVSDGDADTVRLPVVERERLDDGWLQRVPSAVPEHVREALERTGHRVYLRRELVPMQTEDGRQLVVPVDQVEIRYVGRPAL